MPLIAEDDRSEARETSRTDAGGSSSATGGAPAQAEACACEECRAPARDEMWVRWA